MKKETKQPEIPESTWLLQLMNEWDMPINWKADNGMTLEAVINILMDDKVLNTKKACLGVLYDFLSRHKEASPTAILIEELIYRIIHEVEPINNLYT